MKRPLSWLRLSLTILAILIISGVLILGWFVPHYLVHALQRLTDWSFTVGAARLQIPLAISLTDVRWHTPTADSAFSARRILLKPRSLSWFTKEVWFESVEITQPTLRVTRSAPGAWRTPKRAGPKGSGPPPDAPAAHPWHVRVGSLGVDEGVVEVIDRVPAETFRGLLDHINVSVGPVSSLVPNEETTFAVRTELVGAGGHSAPLYCSGWVNAAAKDLEVSCRLEPIVLAAFDPYYLDNPRLDVDAYEATVDVRSQWVARANDLDAQVLLELANITKGRILIRDSPVVAFEELSKGQDPRLQLEVAVEGPLDDPTSWQGRLVPGDARLQKLVQRWIDRRIEGVWVPFGPYRIRIALTPGTAETLRDIEAATKRIGEALEILAVPVPPPPPTPMPAPAITDEGASGQPGLIAVPAAEPALDSVLPAPQPESQPAPPAPDPGLGEGT